MSCYKENYKGFFLIKEKINFIFLLFYYEIYVIREDINYKI